MAFLELVKTIGQAIGNLAKPIGIEDPNGKVVFAKANADGGLLTSAPSNSIDSTGRAKITFSQTQFDILHTYGKEELFWDEITEVNGTATWDADKSVVYLNATTTAGDRVVRETRQYFPYQAGIPPIIEESFVLPEKKANQICRVGFFDDDNGLFFEQNGNEPEGNDYRFVVRSKVSGSVVDTPYGRTSWNVDQVDGTGPSGVIADPSKLQILNIDFLYPGIIRFGFPIDGQFVDCHKIFNANNTVEPFMSTPMLPIRYEILNTGAVASPSTLTLICSTKLSENGDRLRDIPGIIFTAGSQITARPVGSTMVPILAVRPKLLFNGKANRGIVIPLEFNVYAESTVYCVALYNPVLTGANFVSIHSQSMSEYDISATDVSGGLPMYGFYSVKTTGLDKLAADSKLILSLNAAGTSADTICLAAIRLGGTGATSVYPILNFKEIR